jgi:NAD-dependent SIR2 family protein deacetylase
MNSLIPKQKFSYREQIVHLKILNKRGRLAAFIGAGISASCGLPDWINLRKNIKNELLKRNPYITFTEENVEDIARNEFNKEFNFVVAKALYENNDIIISNQIRFLAKSGIDRFVSFNFDDLLEEAINAEMIEHRVILNGEKFNSNYQGLLVFHPHGFLERHSNQQECNWDNIVISKNDYEKLYNDHYCLTNLLQLSILINKSVLFVGMSLNDPNIFRLLQTSWDLGARHWHTAIMRTRETKSENIEIAKRLRGCGVDPLWVNDFFEIDEILQFIKVSKDFNSDDETVN